MLAGLFFRNSPPGPVVVRRAQGPRVRRHRPAWPPVFVAEIVQAIGQLQSRNYWRAQVGTANKGRRHRPRSVGRGRSLVSAAERELISEAEAVAETGIDHRAFRWCDNGAAELGLPGDAGARRALPTVADIESADEWRRKAKGIEAYLRSPEMQKPILSAQRHVEARIGQLLGAAEVGNPNFGHDRNNVDPDGAIAKDDRADFRLLARALAPTAGGVLMAPPAVGKTLEDYGIDKNLAKATRSLAADADGAKIPVCITCLPRPQGAGSLGGNSRLKIAAIIGSSRRGSVPVLRIMPTISSASRRS
jgi:hypothetical protein